MILFPIAVPRDQTAIAGKGIYSRTVPSGGRAQSIYYADAPPAFRGSWYVTGGIIGQEVRVWVDLGLVNTLVPVVGGTPINGTAKKAPPTIAAKINWDPHGRMWVGIKIGINPATGRMANHSQDLLTDGDLTIAVQSSPTAASADGSVWFHPIAMIAKDAGLIQIAYFDYQWGTVKSGSSWRHYLIPA